MFQKSVPRKMVKITENKNRERIHFLEKLHAVVLQLLSSYWGQCFYARKPRQFPSTQPVPLVQIGAPKRMAKSLKSACEGVSFLVKLKAESRLLKLKISFFQEHLSNGNMRQ